MPRPSPATRMKPKTSRLLQSARKAGRAEAGARRHSRQRQSSRSRATRALEAPPRRSRAKAAPLRARGAAPITWAADKRRAAAGDPRDATMKDPSKRATHVLILLAATALAARDKICHPGPGGLFLPFFGDSEQELSTAAEWGRGFLYFRALYYLLGLLWFFLGVSIIADIFMAAIETITSKEKRVRARTSPTRSGTPRSPI